MLYMGGKHRLAKDLLPIILAERRDESQLYWEPFVGGGNVIQYVKGKRLGTDIFVRMIRFPLFYFPVCGIMYIII